jgi:AcrR family transcriptional regulator
MSMVARSPSPRTQAERRASTRAALLDATLTCLTDLGFTRTTTTEVARRAGVSLGALSHHFPTKSDLLTAAVSHLLERRMDDFRTAMRDLPESAERWDTALDLLWSDFRGSAFVAWVELWVGARTDAALRESVLAMSDGFRAGSRELLGELFPAAAQRDQQSLEQVTDLIFAVMEGAALRALVRPLDDAPIRELRRLLGRAGA